MPRSGLARSHENSIFNFLRNVIGGNHFEKPLVPLARTYKSERGEKKKTKTDKGKEDKALPLGAEMAPWRETSRPSKRNPAAGAAGGGGRPGRAPSLVPMPSWLSARAAAYVDGKLPLGQNSGALLTSLGGSL